MHKFNPTGEAYSAPPALLAGFKGRIEAVLVLVWHLALMLKHRPALW